MDYEKKDLQQKKRDKYNQYLKERDYQKKRQIFLEYQILDLKDKLKKLKNN
jgi:hypothetical protein